MNYNKAIVQFSIVAAILTLAILSCSGAADIPSLFATETPTPTITYTPSPTFTPSPTATATQTPSPTPVPTGVYAEEQTNGSTLFIDYDNGYQLLLPPNWEIVFSTQEELLDAFQERSGDDPELADMADNFGDVDPDVFRLAAMNVERKFIRASGPSLLTINAFDDKLTSSMPMAFITAMIEDTLLEGAESTTWDIADSISRVEVGVVKGLRTFSLPDGTKLALQEMVIAFASNEKLIVIEIAAPREFGDEIMAPFEDSIDSIELYLP